MYDGTDDEKQPAGIDERYAGAVASSSLRVGNDHTVATPGDLIAAAGMNQHRMGLSLLRLVSEWNSGAVPPISRAPSAKEIRRDSGLAPDDAEAEARRLAAQATDWHLEEAKLRFQRLKTLPAVRSALLHWVGQRGWEDAEHLVASVLRYFLSPKCSVCGGSGVREFAGNNRRSAGKPCRACEDNRVRGELNVPHGGRGKALLGYLNQCTGQAAHDLREGAHRLRRGDRGEADRFNQRHRQTVEQQQRVDAEEKADALQDTEAVAETFRRSMGGKGSKQ